MDLENGYLVQNLEGITKKDYTIIASGKTAAGSRWGNAIRLKGKGSYVQCNTNGEYRMLSGVFGPSSQFDSALLARVTVYGDDDQYCIHHLISITMKRMYILVWMYPDRSRSA